ncbi:C-type Lectin CRL-like isoform X2 [Saccostrea cucullata]|uniref:C-type Lectin CRL-like isoform X2 n=1 Tax=Saccostrea cuccullata TaxID=36930 RepID=UPI002ED204D8
MNSKLKLRIATLITVSLIICLSIISTMFGLQKDGYNEQKRQLIRLQDITVSFYEISTRGKSTYVLLPVRASWDYAQVLCSDIGGSLAEIETEEEFTSLNYTLRVVEEFKDDLWIGGTDKDKEGVWKWASRSTPIKLTFWRPGEPSNSHNNEHCLEMALYSGYLWNDIYCGHKRRFLCEILQNND